MTLYFVYTMVQKKVKKDQKLKSRVGPALNCFQMKKSHNNRQQTTKVNFYSRPPFNPLPHTRSPGLPLFDYGRVLSPVEVDECVLGTHSCPAKYPCLNTFGAFDCDCNQTGMYFNFKSEKCESKDTGTLTLRTIPFRPKAWANYQKYSMLESEIIVPLGGRPRGSTGDYLGVCMCVCHRGH